MIQTSRELLLAVSSSLSPGDYRTAADGTPSVFARSLIGELMLKGYDVLERHDFPAPAGEQFIGPRMVLRGKGLDLVAVFDAFADNPDSDEFVIRDERGRYIGALIQNTMEEFNSVMDRGRAIEAQRIESARQRLSTMGEVVGYDPSHDTFTVNTGGARAMNLESGLDELVKERDRALDKAQGLSQDMDVPVQDILLEIAPQMAVYEEAIRVFTNGKSVPVEFKRAKAA